MNAEGRRQKAGRQTGRANKVKAERKKATRIKQKEKGIKKEGKHDKSSKKGERMLAAEASSGSQTEIKQTAWLKAERKN